MPPLKLQARYVDDHKCGRWVDVDLATDIYRHVNLLLQQLSANHAGLQQTVSIAVHDEHNPWTVEYRLI